MHNLAAGLPESGVGVVEGGVGGFSTGLYHRINTEIQTLEPLNTVGVRQQKGIWRYVKGDLLLQTLFFFLVYILL